MRDQQARDAARIISSLCGWLYFSLWSLSFYPQLLHNLRHKTTKGLIPDFPLLNVYGFSSYTASTAFFLYSPTIRAQYAARHPFSPEPTVRVNDLVFGINGLVVSIVVYSQFWPKLWGWEQRIGVQRHANKTTLGLVTGSLLALLITIFIVLAKGNASGIGWGWIDVIYCMTYIKLVMTVFKYIPQIMSNFRRKSTFGWPISQVHMDFGGGILSLAQLVIDSALQADWSGLLGNPVKLGLANTSLLADIVFMTQHYILYGPVDEGKDGLVPDSEGEDQAAPLLQSRYDSGSARNSLS